MAKFSQAVWRGGPQDPIPNMDPGQMVRPFRGLVLHVEQGTEAGTNAWFHDPSAKASAHFGNPRSGPLDQWIDTDDKAWAEVAGNRYWISLENEGDSGDALNENQLTNCAQLLAWLHLNENVPLQKADDPTQDTGLGYHAMGGPAWGNHPNCPGKPIIDQRDEIIRRAQSFADTELAKEHGHPALDEMADDLQRAEEKLKH